VSRSFETILLGGYRLLLRTGVLHTERGFRAFERCYDLYKLLIEAAWLKHVKPYVPPGSTVIDVGAHVGFFTQRFASWVGPEGRVLALEPEPTNYKRLCDRIARNGLADRVRAHRIAATEVRGEFRLMVNESHPGDHQLSGRGLPVVGMTLDEVAAEPGLPPLSLIKLDIQGAEARALLGARDLLRRQRPALVVEMDDVRLRRQGASAAELTDQLRALGYVPLGICRSGIWRTLAIPEELEVAIRARSYADLLFVHRPDGPIGVAAP
jgi:FkbM family methyltransferase